VVARRPRACRFTAHQATSKSPLRGRGVGCLGRGIPCLAVSVSSSRLPHHFAELRTQTNRERARRPGYDEMPGLTAPSDYAEEPPRHPALKINSKVSAAPPLPRPCFLPHGDSSDWAPRGVAKRADSFAACLGPAVRMPARVSTVPVHRPITADAGCRSAPLPVCVMRTRAVTVW
jgi:hypothetical protein